MMCILMNSSHKINILFYSHSFTNSIRTKLRVKSQIDLRAILSIVPTRNGPSFGQYRWDSNKFNGRASCQAEEGLRASLGEQVVGMVGLRGPDRPVYMVGDRRTPLSLVLGAKQKTRGASTVPAETPFKPWRGTIATSHVLVYMYIHTMRRNEHWFLELRNLAWHYCQLIVDRIEPKRQSEGYDVNRLRLFSGL